MEALKLSLRSDRDLQSLRRRVVEQATAMGMSKLRVTKLATAVSEIARNALRYGEDATIEISELGEPEAGLRVEVRDRGPGIANLAQAMTDGYSSRGSLGLGLGGARRLVDDFELTSEPGETRVTLMQKLSNRAS